MSSTAKRERKHGIEQKVSGYKFDWTSRAALPSTKIRKKNF